MNQPFVTGAPGPRHPPTPRRASLFWIAGAALLAYSMTVAATGGIDTTVAGIRVRSRTWQRPAALGLACLAAVAIADRRRALAVGGRATRVAARALEMSWLRTSPRVVALAAVAWTLAAGVVFSTRIAGGSDSSGYLNQARLFARGAVIDEARLRERPPWRDAIFTLAPLGFTPAPDGRRLAPTYPPGYPLLMVPGFVLGERAAFWVVPLLGALAVWLTFTLARRLGEPAAGAAAALLVSVSPTFLHQLVQPMSDVPAAALWMLALHLAMRSGVLNAGAAGLVAGAAILVRPNLAPLAVLVWTAAGLQASAATSRLKAVAASMLAAAPSVAGLAIIQAIRFGSPFSSGYGTIGELFSFANVGPNLDRYPRWMIETHTPIILLFLAAPLWIRRAEPQRRRLLFVSWLFAVAVVLAYLPYLYFQDWEWQYTRFLLPALPIMWLLAAAPVAQVLGRRRPLVAALAAIPAGLGLLAFSLTAAVNRHGFDLRFGERKYVDAAAYVNRVMPPNAILVSMQHSGSLWFYTRRPILRWDHLDGRRLDDVVAWCEGQRYSPVFVVDSGEYEEIERRFRPAARRTLDRLHEVARFGDARILELMPAATPARGSGS